MNSTLDLALPYDGRLRRRGRQLGRLAGASARPSMYPRAPMARAFWFDGIANFGDGLTPWLLARLGIIPIHTTASSANFAGVGSILEMLPSGFQGDVWGSGSLDGQELHFPQARFLAVRGELTRDLVGAGSDVPLGDPGILVSRLMKRPPRRWRVGLVPHHFHEDDPIWAEIAGTRKLHDIKVINVRRRPSAVLREIGACEVIVTTSLHGLISADAFGIPAIWTTRPPHLWGGDFKFQDYETALTPGRSREVKLESAASFESAINQARAVDAGVLEARQMGLICALKRARLPLVNPLHSPRHLRR